MIRAINNKLFTYKMLCLGQQLNYLPNKFIQGFHIVGAPDSNILRNLREIWGFLK